MPKLVDYAARYAFVREAAFTVVLEQGVAALSRRSVAQALGTSVNTVRRLVVEHADLADLAADEVVRRRRHGRLGVLRDADPVATAVHLLRKLLPDTEQRVAEELVWLRLVLETHRPKVGDLEELRLADRFQVAEGTYDGSVPAAPVTGDERLRRQRAERDEEVTGLVEWALDVLAVPAASRPAEARALFALVSGLAVEVCPERLSPGDAVTTLTRHIERVARLG